MVLDNFTRNKQPESLALGIRTVLRQQHGSEPPLRQPRTRIADVKRHTLNVILVDYAGLERYFPPTSRHRFEGVIDDIENGTFHVKGIKHEVRDSTEIASQSNIMGLGLQRGNLDDLIQKGIQVGLRTVHVTERRTENASYEAVEFCNLFVDDVSEFHKRLIAPILPLEIDNRSFDGVEWIANSMRQSR